MSNTGVSTFSDPTYGNIAYFDGSSYLDLASGIVPAAVQGTSSSSFSCWVYTSTDGTVHCNGTDTSQDRYRFGLLDGTNLRCDFHTNNRTGTISATDDTWVHCVTTYEDSSNALIGYINGVADISATSSLNTGTNSFSLGRDPTKSSITNLLVIFQILGSMTVCWTQPRYLT